MPDVDYHGWTHRPKSEGGTDPVEGWLPYCVASNNADAQSVTDDEELVFSTNNGQVRTNSPGTFAFDTTDPSGVIIYRTGVYRMAATVHYAVGDASDAREIYVTCQLLSLGPLGGLGSAFGDGNYSQLGPGQSQASVSAVTSSNTIPKVALFYQAIGPVTASAAAPMRAAVILQHNTGVDYSVEGLASALFIERIGALGLQAPNPSA